MPAWMIVTEWFARLILLLLVGLSIWSIAIILERRRYFKELEEQVDECQAFDWLEAGNKEAVRSELANKQDIVSKSLSRAQSCDSVERIDRAVSAFLSEQKRDMEQKLIVLGTLGSTTPFIGLLGTILGIIVAFGSLSIGQIDSKQIMYVLAEALVLTAAGLTVAIPAVIAFNIFSKKIRTLLARCEQAKNQFIAGGFYQ